VFLNSENCTRFERAHGGPSGSPWRETGILPGIAPGSPAFPRASLPACRVLPAKDGGQACEPSGDRAMRYAAALLMFVAAGTLSPAEAQVLYRPSANRAERTVEEWYQNYLGRAPDADGLKCWSTMLRRGATPNYVLGGILGSPEYYQAKGN